MRIVSIHDKSRLLPLIQQESYLHMYALGDLDELFFRHTTWYGIEDDRGILKELIVMFTLLPEPAIQALTKQSNHLMQELLQRANTFLPRQFHVHISDNLLASLNYDINSDRGRFYKMALRDTSKILAMNPIQVKQLSEQDSDAIRMLYRVSYPNAYVNWEMVADKRYYGIWDNDQLVSIAGLHVCSVEHHAAVIGAVTTHPDYRGQQLAMMCIAIICQKLLAQGITIIGLNVHAENVIALKLYKSLGFEVAHEYNDYSLIASGL